MTRNEIIFGLKGLRDWNFKTNPEVQKILSEAIRLLEMDDEEVVTNGVLSVEQISN